MKGSYKYLVMAYGLANAASLFVTNDICDILYRYMMI